MSALTKDLMGAGMAASLASKLGEVVFLQLSCVGTVQAGAPVIVNNVTTLTTGAGAVSAVLDSSAPLGARYEVFVETATSATVFPEVGGTIDGGTVNTSVTIAQGKGRLFRKVAPLTWRSIAGA